ncbi:MAG: sigma-70 family RNA polymerase sigma factor [Oscillospiraceae bacterium]|nr:sigma-70 family RNA polymerase sigma factor [Oscillospiraceae bacterium]
MDDASIIDLFRRRDERAIAELKQKYEKLCLYVAGNFLSQREDAEECVSTAYYEIWNNIPPDSPDDLRTYLCRIVRNIAINRLKYNTAGKRNPAAAVPLDEIADCVPAKADDSIADGLLADAVSRFLRSQTEQHRKVFVRRYWYGDSLSQIAAQYGMKEKTVATALFRTRKKLKAFLQKEGYDYE